MSVTILVCPCGRRLKATGMVPGKSGRCPSCGALLRVPATEPSPSAPPVAPPVEDEWNWEGTYDLDPGEPPPAVSEPELEWTPPVDPWERWPHELDAVSAPEPPETLPPPPLPPAETTEDDEWNCRGKSYGLGEDGRLSSPPPAFDPAIAFEAAELVPRADPDGRVPKKFVERPAPPPPDPWFPPRILYPLREAEGFGMVAALGVTFWVMGTLVPEYCLGLLADGELLGTPSMGRLIAVISALPVMVLSPLAVIYWLQYLARVLEASGEGENRPPRPPDRNFDGLFSGLGSWLLWLVFGASPVLLPLGVCLTLGEASPSPALAVGIGLVGLPYALMALMMTFLHDDPLAANPLAVIGNLAKLTPSFLGLSLTVATTLGLGLGSFAAALLLIRNGFFWVYIPTSLACWALMAWTSIVAMHTLGSYYAARRGRLKWRQGRSA